MSTPIGNTLKVIAGGKPHRTTHTKTDTIELTPQLVRSWKNPSFQRGLRVNKKVEALALVIRTDGGIVPGVITLGVLGKDTYLLDGQHRIHAFLMSEAATGYCDVRICYCEDMAEMGEEFVNLNSRLVNLKPDDILRGMEESIQTLRTIRQSCPFIGYDMVRRSARSPVVSMAAALRCWFMSAPDTPGSASGLSAMGMAQAISSDDAETMISFLKACEAAWGRDEAYYKLWGGLNLTVCAWLYRRTVITGYSANTARLTKDEFKRCLMSLSADGSYLDWLVGRMLNDRDRSPAYTRIKAIFAKRIEEDKGAKPRLPQPAWSGGK